MPMFPSGFFLWGCLNKISYILLIPLHAVCHTCSTPSFNPLILFMIRKSYDVFLLTNKPTYHLAIALVTETEDSVLSAWHTTSDHDPGPLYPLPVFTVYFIIFHLNVIHFQSSSCSIINLYVFLASPIPRLSQHSSCH